MPCNLFLLLCPSGSEDALHLLVDRSMRVAETALHSYRSQDRAAGDKAALLLQAVKLLSLLSKCAMPNGGDVSALFEEHMRNAANRRYRSLKAELQRPALGMATATAVQTALCCLPSCASDRPHSAHLTH